MKTSEYQLAADLCANDKALNRLAERREQKKKLVGWPQTRRTRSQRARGLNARAILTRVAAATAIKIARARSFAANVKFLLTSKADERRSDDGDGDEHEKKTANVNEAPTNERAHGNGRQADETNERASARAHEQASKRANEQANERGAAH